MGYPVVHFEVIGKDPQALKDFYKGAFDWEIGPSTSDANNYSMAMPQGEGGINGGIGGGMTGYGGHGPLYVRGPGLDAAPATSQSLRGTPLIPPEQSPNGPGV